MQTILVKAHQSHRAVYHTTQSNYISRKMKPNLAEKYHNKIKQFLDVEKTISSSDYNLALKNIHQTEINNYINSNPAKLTGSKNFHKTQEKVGLLVILAAFLLNCAAD